MIRTRFAPSPTGDIHIGNIRSALFAYLFAKHNGGEFFLRIEDTDRERYVEGSMLKILELMEWLSLLPDNYHSIVIQSERLDLYKKMALTLVEGGHAYVCDCSKERLETMRREQEEKKQPPHYDRHCRERKLEYKDGCVIRLKMPLEGEIVVEDAIRGNVTFSASLIDDQVLLKSDGFPTYHLAAVVDDHEMNITHVIRAEEWLASTPKHLMLYKYFGWQPPVFAHLPLILGPDKKKLSKRHGATSALAYKQDGYLPSALINFIALLGWNPKDERELFSLSELVKEFTLENVNKSPAVFNIEKLNDINEKYIRALDPKGLHDELEGFGLDASEGEIALAQRGGYKTLVEIVEAISKLRMPPDYPASLLIFKKSTESKIKRGLTEVRQKLAGTNIWSSEELQNVLIEVVNEQGLSNGDVFWPVRVALSGEEKSPSPTELLYALGKVESLKRIDLAIKKLG